MHLFVSMYREKIEVKDEAATDWKDSRISAAFHLRVGLMTIVCFGPFGSFT